jgi:hypothetical protein
MDISVQRLNLELETHEDKSGKCCVKKKESGVF